MITVYATTLPGWFDTRFIAKAKWLQQLRYPSSARAGMIAEPPTTDNKWHDTKLITLQKILMAAGGVGAPVGLGNLADEGGNLIGDESGNPIGV